MKQPADLAYEYLQEEGFRPEREEDGTVHFKYERCHYVVVNFEDDDEYLHIVMPRIYDFTADKRLSVLDAANETNILSKGGNILVTEDDVHVAFETLLSENSDLHTIFPRALDMLQNARTNFYNEIGD